VRRYICKTIFFIIAGTALCPHTLMPKAHGLAESTGPDGSNAKAVHALGETGDGINVGLISAGNTRVTHEAFKNAQGDPNAFAYDFTGDGIQYSSHDTWVAGVVASRGGAAHPNDLGVAPGANIHSARVVDDGDSISFTYITEALDYLISVKNCRVIVTGIQLYDSILAIPDGNSIWTKIYDYYAYNDDVVFANAAGNFLYDACGILITNRITIFGDAYNGITTGGLRITNPDVYGRIGSISCEGPTQDGRNKPELAAPVQNQTVPSGSSDTSWLTWTSAGGETSFSAPHTAGVAALLLGLADNTNNPNDGHNEVIKAVIVNSTFPNIKDRSGNPTNPADPNNTWHPERGYGRLDALRAYELLDSNQVLADVNITEEKGWAYATMTNSFEEDSYRIHGEKNERFVLTVTWNRLIDSNYAEETPKFNLNLTIKDPNDQTIFSETDTLNNLKKVDLLLPGDGVYKVVVKNTTTKNNRKYALAFELLSPIPGDFYPADYIVDYNDMATLSEQWLLEGENLEADLFDDDSNIVNLPDFAEFANHWLETDSRYYQSR